MVSDGNDTDDTHDAARAAAADRPDQGSADPGLSTLSGDALLRSVPISGGEPSKSREQQPSPIGVNDVAAGDLIGLSPLGQGRCFPDI